MATDLYIFTTKFLCLDSAAALGQMHYTYLLRHFIRFFLHIYDTYGEAGSFFPLSWYASNVFYPNRTQVFQCVTFLSPRLLQSS